MTTSRSATSSSPSLDELFAAYLSPTAAGDGRAGPRRGTHGRPDAEGAIDLLRSALNGYGYQYLSQRDERRFSRAYNDGDEGAFCRLFGARMLVAYLDEYLDDFLIRKVLFRVEDLEITIKETARFIDWLEAKGHLAPATVRRARERVIRAADEVPAAERLGRALHAELKRVPVTGHALRGAETVDDYLIVRRVTPGKIWFRGLTGPLEVPPGVSALARPGWSINLVLARLNGRWHIVEVGNVYPRVVV